MDSAETPPLPKPPFLGSDNFEAKPSWLQVVYGGLKLLNPDPPILAFFDFLAFFVFRFPLLFCAFFLSFPRILGVPRREEPLHFLGFPWLFFPKRQGFQGQGKWPKVAHSVPKKGPGL